MPMTKDDVQMPRHPDLEKIIVRGDKACAGHFFDHIIQKFRQTGIDKDPIRVETVHVLDWLKNRITTDTRKVELPCTFS